MSVARFSLNSAGERVLVTGGCGFLGCNIAAGLVARGCRVVVMDNLSRSGSRQNAEWLKRRYGNSVTIEMADTRNPDAVRVLVASSGAVMHLAGQVAVTTSLDDPITDFEINARGTLNVLEAVRRHNPDAPVIFASTNKVYGRLFEDSEVQRVNGQYVPNNPRFAQGVAEDAAIDLH